MPIHTQTETLSRLGKKLRNDGMPKALLVGESPQGSSYLAKRLWERGCQCMFATSYEEARSLLKTHEFCVVLSPTRLHTRTLLPLMDLLEGSNVSLFYVHLVERGCWWLPAIRRGHKCFGSYAVRPSEFVSLLDQTIDDIRVQWRTTDEEIRGPANFPG